MKHNPTENINNPPSLDPIASYSISSDPTSRSPSPQIPLEVLSGILPQLPCEILTNILMCIRNDKVSLARCMRVSSTFNAIARPILYSTVIMETGKKNPYDTSKGVYRIVPGRSSPDMSKNLEHIKHVIVNHHHPPSKLMGLTTKVYDIDCLRLRTRALSRNQPCGRCKDKLDLGNRSCLFQMYRPKKLVVDGASIDCSQQPVVDSARLETLVFRIAVNSTEFLGGWSPRPPSPR